MSTKPAANKEPEIAEVLELPLWKNVVKQMEADGLEENKAWPLSYFVERLREPEKSAALAFALNDVRRGLRELGWWLSSRNSGAEMWLHPRRENAKGMERFTKKAVTALRNGVILGTNTPMDCLTDEERRRHEGVLEKMALRSVLMNRKLPEKLK